MQHFEKVAIRATKYWKDSTGKRRQKTKEFYQTINPYNTNPDGIMK